MEAEAARIAAMTPLERHNYDLALMAHRTLLMLDADSDPLGRIMGEIATERLRQIDGEGWTRDHDDAHNDFEMARAAACYAVAPWRRTEHAYLPRPFSWPWAEGWWKPSTNRRDLIKAAALIVAEIERLDRAGTKGGAA